MATCKDEGDMTDDQLINIAKYVAENPEINRNIARSY